MIEEIKFVSLVLKYAHKIFEKTKLYKVILDDLGGNKSQFDKSFNGIYLNTIIDKRSAKKHLLKLFDYKKIRSAFKNYSKNANKKQFREATKRFVAAIVFIEDDFEEGSEGRVLNFFEGALESFEKNIEESRTIAQHFDSLELKGISKQVSGIEFDYKERKLLKDTVEKTINEQLKKIDNLLRFGKRFEAHKRIKTYLESIDTTYALLSPEIKSKIYQLASESVINRSINQAEVFLDKSLHWDSENQSALNIQAKILAKKGDTKKAIELLRRSDSRRSLHLRLALAIDFDLDEESDEIINNLPGDLDYELNRLLGFFYTKKGNFDKAIGYANDSIKKFDSIVTRSAAAIIKSTYALHRFHKKKYLI